MSTDKEKVLKTSKDLIKDPFVLEFLDIGEKYLKALKDFNVSAYNI